MKDGAKIVPDPHLVGVSRVYLTNGVDFALVDDEDVCRVDELRWSLITVRVGNQTYRYAVASTRPQVRMHRHLFGLGKNDRRVVVDHKNGDGLDNRRTNLRPTTHDRNITNSVKQVARRGVAATSRYKGVSRHKQGKWLACIQKIAGQPVKKTVFLGTYEIEEEAAFAFQVAAPLIHDPEFLRLEAIPPDRMPSPERQREIRERVLFSVKAKLAGRRARVNPHSAFYGVTLNRANGVWTTHVNLGGKVLNLGSYATPEEAAYARECAADLPGVRVRGRNNIKPGDLPGDRGREIAADVLRRAEAFLDTGKSRRTASRYRGVYFRAGRKTWVTRVYGEWLGDFPTEAEAAYAYNAAVEALQAPRLTPNVIPADLCPAPDRAAEIRRAITSRLANNPKHPFPSQETHRHERE